MSEAAKYYPWMNADQLRCADLLASVFSGFHNMKKFGPRANGVGVILHQRDLSTFDFCQLTSLVIKAHQQCIRVAVCLAGMHLEVRAYPRVPASDDHYRRHPDLLEMLRLHAPEIAALIPQTTPPARAEAEI